MSPNPLLALKFMVSPHRWVKSRRRSSATSQRKFERWEAPIKGIYEFTPGRGWALVYAEEPTALSLPHPVTYSRIMGKHMLKSDYQSRKCHGKIQSTNTNKDHHVGFFRVDIDAYVLAWDKWGNFIPGPWELWTVNPDTGLFRKATRRASAGNMVFDLPGDKDKTESPMEMCSVVSSRPVSIRESVRDSKADIKESVVRVESIVSQLAVQTPSAPQSLRRASTGGSHDVSPAELRTRLAALENGTAIVGGV
ncbi:hypothetical protein EJ06DRAFT_564021 [Trichodelitschia bisporula]|uniref:Uncharacterized protein n=1 Tax=Trichodelitschia bisporula TaxID=703511 RepID=A0A6G1HRY1_9PEZI|nr:hypothetical protein EJ06DRAFT_564021 [Trichodelitschia bisporula]